MIKNGRERWITRQQARVQWSLDLCLRRRGRSRGRRSSTRKTISTSCRYEDGHKTKEWKEWVVHCAGTCCILCRQETEVEGGFPPRRPDIGTLSSRMMMRREVMVEGTLLVEDDVQALSSCFGLELLSYHRPGKVVKSWQYSFLYWKILLICFSIFNQYIHG